MIDVKTKYMMQNKTRLYSEKQTDTATGVQQPVEVQTECKYLDPITTQVHHHTK